MRMTMWCDGFRRTWVEIITDKGDFSTTVERDFDTNAPIHRARRKMAKCPGGVRGTAQERGGMRVQAQVAEW